MKQRLLYVGLDVHKNTTDVAIANGRSNITVIMIGSCSSSAQSENALFEVMTVLPFHTCWQ
jgi:hypothetical protein